MVARGVEPPEVVVERGGRVQQRPRGERPALFHREKPGDIRQVLYPGVIGYVAAVVELKRDIERAGVDEQTQDTDQGNLYARLFQVLKYRFHFSAQNVI